MNNTNRESQDDSFLNGVPYQTGHESTRKSRRWKWPVTAMLTLVVALMLPSRAQAGIFDIFGELFGTIQNDRLLRPYQSDRRGRHKAISRCRYASVAGASSWTNNVEPLAPKLRQRYERLYQSL
jgi:hypothetical protein